MPLRDNVVLFLALVLSVGVHVVALPLVYDKKPPMTFLPPSKATHLETPRNEPPDIELGIDESKESTLTWIGYEEYEEQKARFANVEQAAMKTELDVATQPNEATAAVSALQQLVQPMSELTKQLFEALQGIEITTPSKELPPVPKTEPVVIDSQPVKPVAEVIEETPVEGSPSDRDSEATSIVKISPDEWKSGKPLAAHGIVLRPRRPSFTANQLVTNAPSDLVAELQIDRRGKPIQVILIYSTGSTSIDRSLVSSLYRWRASGDAIDKLLDDNTFNITIHITFAK
jgi:hypothetical protein